METNRTKQRQKPVKLDLKQPIPFRRFKMADEWMRHRRPIDCTAKRTGWGEGD